MWLSAAAVSLAFVLDAAIGEPPQRVHPVAWFGRLVGPLDRDWSRPRLVGGVATALLPLGAALAVGAYVWAGARWHSVIGAGLAALALFASTSLRRLLTVAREVTTASDGEVDAARDRLRALAGRDAASLSPGEVRSAVVESVAENLADGLVAPLGAFAALAVLGSRTAPALGVEAAPFALTLGSAGAAWVKAVNTMDSMLGYRSKPVGWAPARLDDAVMWLPARVSAALLAAATGSPAALRAARQWTGDVPSPNSGWPMGTLAAALDVRLTKPGAYELNPDASLPTVDETGRGIRFVAAAGGLAYLLAGVVAWV